MKLSVILPVYNKETYVEEMLTDLIGQSFSDFECLVIDDGSTDNSGRLCDQMAGKDTRIRVFHQENKGVSAARNRGLDCACGEYITFVDADDRIRTDYLLNLVRSIEDQSVDMVITGHQKTWRDSGKVQSGKPCRCGRFSMEELLPHFAKDQQETGIYGFVCGKILKRETVGATRFSEEIGLAEDLDFYVSLYPKIKTIFFDEKEDYIYLQEAENSSMQKKDWEFDYDIQLQIQLKIYRYLMSYSPDNTENEPRMTKRIYDYVYFSVFHAPWRRIVASCRRIRTLELPPWDASLFGGNQKTVLWLLSRGHYRMIQWSLMVRRACRGSFR